MVSWSFFFSVYKGFRVVGSLVAEIVLQRVKQEGKELFNEMISILSIKQEQNDKKHPDAQMTPN